MHQLWSTGWLHNRIRVVCASFLVKNLLLPWQWGLKHYWDALLDADLECAALGWQYCSGCLAGERAGVSMGGLACMVRRVCNLSFHQLGEVLPETRKNCESRICLAAASLHPALSCVAWAGTGDCPAAHGNTGGMQIHLDLWLSASAWNFQHALSLLLMRPSADAHPFSYMLNHKTEAQRFDPDGNYVRRWLPALARLPVKWIHRSAYAPACCMNLARCFARLVVGLSQPQADQASHTPSVVTGPGRRQRAFWQMQEWSWMATTPTPSSLWRTARIMWGVRQCCCNSVGGCSCFSGGLFSTLLCCLLAQAKPGCWTLVLHFVVSPQKASRVQLRCTLTCGAQPIQIGDNLSTADKKPCKGLLRASSVILPAVLPCRWCMPAA